jgi:hypothetical protein
MILFFTRGDQRSHPDSSHFEVVAYKQEQLHREVQITHLPTTTMRI